MVAVLTVSLALARLDFDQAAARAEVGEDTPAPLSALTRELLLDLMEAYGFGFQWSTTEYTTDDVDAALATAQRELMEEAAPVSSDYELIADVILASAGSYIQVADIPDTYRHLKLECQFKVAGTSETDEDMLIWFNGDDSSANYDYRFLRQRFSDGQVISGVTGSQDTGRLPYATMNETVTDDFSKIDMTILDYAAVDRRKGAAFQAFKTGGYSPAAVTHGLTRWNVADDPIDTIRFEHASGANLLAGCRVTLYGLKGS
jgi:hypothetical protein